MKLRNPYIGQPDFQFWKKEPGISNYQAFDPVTDVPFQLAPSDKIVTAGSCFAQHVARYMSNSGFNHFITENAHPIFSEEITKQFNYGMFAARYGNIYTTRQLKQLLLRAFGEFKPIVTSWVSKQGSTVVDPFRPQIQPNGFESEAELEADRKQHFEAIRKAICGLDVFVFTLGLTECWIDKRDGSVFPLAPGVAGGIFDENVEFKNMDLNETVEDLRFSLEFIRAQNPKAKFILTVSPVPLNATYEKRHVFSATTLSKAVLRLAAEQIAQETDNCAYFPSYEVITSPHVRGRYFAEDCREVTEAGVSHAMRLFASHFTKDGTDAQPSEPVYEQNDTVAEHLREMQEAIDVLCDEEAISNT